MRFGGKDGTLLYLDWWNIRRQLKHGLLRRRGAYYRLDLRRLAALAVVFTLFLIGRVPARLFRLLDAVLFPGHRRVQITEPLFVIGNFRGGTTLMHRLLAADSRRFTALTTGEIYLAHTVSQRKFFRGLAMVDRRLGGFGQRAVRRWDKRNLGNVPLHPISLFAPEEDVGLLLFTWSGLFSWFVFPRANQPVDFSRFDQEVPAPIRRRLMRHYRDCAQRHLYDKRSRGQRGLRFLAKNPSFTPMIRSLRQAFPDARFVYMFRDPHETFASTAAWFRMWLKLMGRARERYPLAAELLTMVRSWYDYAAETLPTLPRSAWAAVQYTDLIADPPASIAALYRHFGFSSDAAHRNALEQLLRVRGAHQSDRQNHIGEIGLAIELIDRTLAGVMDRQRRLLH